MNSNYNCIEAHLFYPRENKHSVYALVKNFPLHNLGVTSHISIMFSVHIERKIIYSYSISISQTTLH